MLLNSILYFSGQVNQNTQKDATKIFLLYVFFTKVSIRKDVRMQFKPVAKQDASKLRKYYQDCQYGLCEYSVGTKLMWRKTLHPAWTEVAGCLVVRNEID